MVLGEETKEKITDILLNQLTSKINEYKEANDMEKPFYSRLFSEKTVALASILQSTYTWFGSQWENIARIIAENNTNKFSSVKYHYSLDGTITSAEEAAIGKILRELDRGDRKPNLKAEKKEIEASYSKTLPKENHNEIVDLFLKTNDNKEIYFEIKSVKPNKNEMRAARQDLLHIIAMRQKVVPIDNISIFVVLPYNIYSEKYKRWTVIKFFNLGEDLLVGKDFWDFLGGESTYEELLDLFAEIGKEIMDKLDKTIRKKRPRSLEDFK